MDNAAADRIEQKLKSVFPEGAIARVEVLEYGDDPKVEPGGTAIRAFIGPAGRPEGTEADHDPVQAFQQANGPALKKLHDELPRFIQWVDFRPVHPAGTTGHHGLVLALRTPGPRAKDEVPEDMTPVMTRLGAADLATVDTLITAGIATSRAEVPRWAVGRIREHPAYAQIQERVHEIDQLKAQF
jgi:hypothetical protein